MATFGIYPKTQLCWLIGPLILNIGFPLPADVNRALWGGGVPEDRTPTVPLLVFDKKYGQFWYFSQIVMATFGIIPLELPIF